ncbi:hypothetical protein V5F53_16720 [Xanthobacter sp. V4C-4]|uniref:hypothetical protein n=1 Tax=Xanthobacter cornucopiae TaxID=3119924 RepID=UPI003729B516
MTHTTTIDTIPVTAGHAIYGTAPAAYIPANMIASGFYELCPAALRPDGSQPRALFDVTTEEGRTARDAFNADREIIEAAKDRAYARHAATLGAGEGMNGDGI